MFKVKWKTNTIFIPDSIGTGSHLEIFAECSILFKFKEGENFNHRNILDISRIKI